MRAAKRRSSRHPPARRMGQASGTLSASRSADLAHLDLSKLGRLGSQGPLSAPVVGDGPADNPRHSLARTRAHARTRADIPDRVVSLQIDGDAWDG